MRRFEFSDAKSNKFWEISTDGALVTVRFGRIGTNGQTKSKDHGTSDAAIAEAEKLVHAKTKKGYIEIGASPSGDAGVEDSEAVQATLKALADIKEWLVDQGAASIVESLNAPATNEQIDAAEAVLGHPLPAELRAVFGVHNGQQGVDDPYRNTLFPYGMGSLVPLEWAVRSEVGRFIYPPDGGPALVAYPEQTVPISWIHIADSGSASSELLPEECSTAWLNFAWDENFRGFIHLRTGRVFQWVKEEGLSLYAPSFASFMTQLADDLWNGKYTLERDPFDDEVPLEERGWTWS